MRELVDRLRAFGARHEFLTAALFFTVLACLWSWPMFKGDQLGQDYVLYRSVPWKAERPADLHVTPRSTDADIATQQWPMFNITRREARHGRLALWNPYIYGGNTLIGDMQTQLLWPLTWLGWLLPAGFAWGLIATLKLVIAGFGTYLVARQLRLGHGAGLVAGSVYALSAPIILWLQWPLGTVYILLPWLLWAADRVYREPTAARVAVLAVAVAANVFGGHPESAVINAAVVGLYLVVTAALDTARARRERLRALAGTAIGYAAGTLLAAPVALPFLTALSESISRISHIQAGHGLPAWTAITYALPNIFGVHQITGVKQLLTYSGLSMYFGAAALVLALVGAWSYRRSASARALMVVAIGCALVLFGVPPFKALFRDVSPFKLLVITRMYVPLALIGALGAGAAVTALVRRPLPVRSIPLFTAGLGASVAVVALLARVTGVAGAKTGLSVLTRSGVVEVLARAALFFVLGALCLWALGRLRRPLAIGLVLVVCVADLGLFQDYNVWLSPAGAHPRTPPSFAFLARQPRPFRVSPWAPGDIRQVMPPNTNALYTLESPIGYYYPESERWARLTHDVLLQQGLSEHPVSDPVPSDRSLEALRALNVRYYLTPPTAGAPAPAMRAVYRGADAKVWLDPVARPRAYVVARRSALPSRANPPRPARARETRLDRVEVTVPPGRGGWLVLANGYTKQWKAKVDGREVKMRPTSYAAMALPVAAGAHSVVFYFDRDPFWIGVALCAATALVLLAVVLVARRRRGRSASLGRVVTTTKA